MTPAEAITSASARKLKPLSVEKAILPVRTGDVLVHRYRLEEKIGEGGMGAVFIAHDVELDRQVAVKMLAASLVNDVDVLERFEREARLTAKLDHPHIVPIYDVGRHEGRPFIVMKFLRGHSLVDRLRSKGGFSVEETLQLMRQLALGLDYIHARGFIHRDIKAANIFISPEGHATILDFGIFRQLDAKQGLTRTGMVMGTPHYMAPEQALGLKELDHRVDLYALAVVLFECLTGTLPFEADSELRLIQLQAHAPVPELLDRAPWIPSQVAQVVKKALAKSPADRFNTAAALVAALESAYSEAKSSPSKGVVEPSTGELSRAIQASRRPWLSLSFLSVVLIGLGAALWATQNNEPSSAPVADGEPPPSIVPDAGELLVALDEVAVPEPRVESDAGNTVISEPVSRKTALKKKGRVNVITTHHGEPYWAQVSIDGIPKGRTPLLLELSVGKYQLRIERSGFRTHLQEVRVTSGRQVLVKIELVP